MAEDRLTAVLARKEIYQQLSDNEWTRVLWPAVRNPNLLTLPRQTRPGGKLTNHSEEGYDEENAPPVHGGIQVIGGCSAR